MMAEQESTQQDRILPIPDDGMDIDIIDVLDDECNVGLVEVEPGEATVRYQEARTKFSVTVEKWGHNDEYVVGDEDSTLFLSSDGGELNVGYGPEFAPVETAIKVWQYELAVSEIRTFTYEDYDVWFDHTGLVAFVGPEATAAVAPTRYSFWKPHPDCGPRTPGGPTA